MITKMAMGGGASGYTLGEYISTTWASNSGLTITTQGKAKGVIFSLTYSTYLFICLLIDGENNNQMMLNNSADTSGRRIFTFGSNSISTTDYIADNASYALKGYVLY